MPPSVSIIVPCYNVASYLGECLDSATEQSYENLQIITVDDGSTDETLPMLRTRSASDSRILLIEKKNAGAGAARNTGLDHATGDYILFIDSDDFLARDGIEKLVREAEQTYADITMGARVKFNSKGSHINPPHTYAEYRAGVTALEYPPVFGVIAIHGKLFRTSFIRRHHLAFQETLAQEDFAFSYVAYRQARRITVLTDPIYYYRKRDGGGDASLTQSRLKKQSLLGRFVQVETTLTLASGMDGKRATPHRRPFNLEFGKRLMRHIVKLAWAPEDPATVEALGMIAMFSYPYRAEIQKHCAPTALAVYRAVWKRDLVKVRSALRKQRAAEKAARNASGTAS
jgi:glycosyltransferase involved in cell wall biosynthesis